MTSPKGTSTVTWANGGTTTFTYKSKILSTSKEKCGTGNTEATVSGKVTKSTGPASGVKGKVKGDVCIIGTSLSLLLGTVFKF